MSLCNAVRIDLDDGQQVWVTDDASIDTYGREEEIYSARGAVNAAKAQEIGATYLAGRKAPLVSTEVSPSRGAVAGVDYDEGDTVDVDGEVQRCVGIDRKLNTTNGLWLPRKPSFTSLVDESKQRADRAIERLISEQGGGAVSATAAPSKLDIDLGPVRKIETLKWAWYDSADSGDRVVLDDVSTWHDEQITQVCRMGSILCTVDYDGATGWSHFELFKNGSEWNPLFEIVMDATPPLIPFAYVRVYGYEFLFPGDVLTWRCTVNGQHRQGALSIDLVPAT